MTLFGLRTGGHQIVDTTRCPACSHPARFHNPAGCVSAQCECSTPRAELMPDAPRLEVPDGVESTPAVKATAQADGGRGHAAQGRPVQADAPAAAPVVPVRPSSAWDPPKLLPLPPLPGAGIPRTPPMVVEVTTPDEDVARQVDEVIAEGKAKAARLYADRSSRRTSARPAAPALGAERAAPGGPDAVEEVAATAVDGPVAATAEPACTNLPGCPVHPDVADAHRATGRVLREMCPCMALSEWHEVGVEGCHFTEDGQLREPAPLDLAPFLNRSLTYYAAWACDHHPLQRRHNPGGCPDCSRALVPVYVVVIPQELS